jgi:iron complex outermembrane receptor protein
MHFLRPRPLVIALGFTLSAIVPTTLLAEGALEEVVVTAQKRTQNLQDVPVAVSAFSGETLRESGVRDMQDLSGIALTVLL